MNWLKRNIRYFMLTLFIGINGLIVFESSLKGGASSLRSSLITLLVGDVINKTIPPKPYTQVGVESITLKRHDQTPLGEGDTYFIPVGVTRRLTTVLLPATATDKSVTYTSSDPSVLRVTQGGFLEARSIGSVSLNVTSNNNNNVTQTFIVTVIEKLAPPVYELNINKTSFDVNTTAKLSVSLTEAASREYDVYKLPFYSSNETVATINQYGVIQGKSVGTSTIGVLGNPDSFIVEVTSPSTPIILANDFTISGPSDNIAYVYDKTPLSFSFDENITDQSITLVSSNDAIGKVVEEAGNYFVYGSKVSGEVTLTAYLNTDFTIFKTLTLQMEEILPTALTARFDGYGEVAAGSRLKIIPTLTHSVSGKEHVVVTNQEIKYSVDDPKIATASSDGDFGYVVGKSVGTTTITLTSVANNELSTALVVTVNLKPRINDDNINDLHGFLRKFLGHFMLFFVDGVVGLITLYLFFKPKLMKSGLISLSIGLFFASFSEFLQYFIPNRAGLISDVLIDFGGYLSATLIVYLIIYLINKRKSQKLAQINEK